MCICVTVFADWWWRLHAWEANGLPASPPWAGQWAGLDWWLPPPGGPLGAGDWGGRPGGLSFTWGPCPRQLWGLRGRWLSFIWVLYLLRAQRLWLLQCKHRWIQALPAAPGEANAAVQCQAATSGRTLWEAGAARQLPQEPPWAAGGHSWGADHAATESAPAGRDGGSWTRHGPPAPRTLQVETHRINVPAKMID